MPRFSSIEISPQALTPPVVFQASLRPGVVAEFAGMRDGVECPDELAGEDVVRAEIARRIAVAFAGRGAEDDQVLEDPAGSAALDVADGLRVAAEAFAQIDAAVLAEGVDGDAGLRLISWR